MNETNLPKPTLTLTALNDAGRKFLGSDAEVALTTVMARRDDLGSDVDKLAVIVEKLIRERQHTLDVLTAYLARPWPRSGLGELYELRDALKGGR